MAEILDAEVLTWRRAIPTADQGAYAGGPPATGPVQAEPQGFGLGPDTIGAPGVRQPPNTVQTSTYPQVVLQITDAVTVPTQGVGADLQFAAPGVLRIAGALASDATGTIPTWTVDGGTTWLNLNGGTALSAGAWYEEQVTVIPGVPVNFSTADVSTWAVLWVIYTPST